MGGIGTSGGGFPKRHYREEKAKNRKIKEEERVQEVGKRETVNVGN